MRDRPKGSKAEGDLLLSAGASSLHGPPSFMAEIAAGQAAIDLQVFDAECGAGRRGRPLPLATLLTLIAHAYEAKARADVVDDRKGNRRQVRVRHIVSVRSGGDRAADLHRNNHALLFRPVANRTSKNINYMVG